jgi:hypothetical protein
LEANIMKRYAILTVVVLAILVVAWTAFGQEEGRAERRQQMENMRQRFQNMSEEEREKFRAQMRERGGGRRGEFLNPEEQQKSIKAIEEQLAKLKAAQFTRPEGGFQNLSEEERTKFREKIMKVFQDRQSALQAITAQVARLQGRRQPEGEGARYLIISANDLKPIQEAAKKEKAKETGQLLERLIARGSGRRGFGGRPPGAGPRPQGGRGDSERPTRRR